MKQIKIQIANEIHPDQAQDLLKTLYNLLNVAGNLNDSFLNELCSDYSSNMVDTEKTAPERTDNLSFDPKPITNELSLNEQSSESKVSDRDLTIRIDGIDQENTQLKIRHYLNRSNIRGFRKRTNGYKNSVISPP